MEGVEYGEPEWAAEEDTKERRAAARAVLDDGALLSLSFVLHLSDSLLRTAFATDKRRRAAAKAAAARTVGTTNLPDASALGAHVSRAVERALTAAALAGSLAQARNIPPHDEDATSPADAYPLLLLAGRDLHDALAVKAIIKAARGAPAAAAGAEEAAAASSAFASKAAAAPLAADAPLHPYAASFLNSVSCAEGSGERKAAARRVAYLGLLLSVWGAPYGGMDPAWLGAALRSCGCVDAAQPGAYGAAAAHVVQRFTEPHSGAAGATSAAGALDGGAAVASAFVAAAAAAAAGGAAAAAGAATAGAFAPPRLAAPSFGPRLARTQKLADLLLSHIIAAALSAGGHRLPLPPLAAALGKDAASLVKHAAALGCKVEHKLRGQPAAVLALTAERPLRAALPSTAARPKANKGR